MARSSSAIASLARQRPHRLEAEHLRRDRRRRHAPPPPRPARTSPRARARMRAAERLARAPRGRRRASAAAVSAVQSRGCSGTSVLPACQSSSARTTRLRSFGWTRAAARGSRRSRMRVRRRRAAAVVEALPALAVRSGGASAGSANVGQRGLEPEPGAADDDRRPPRGGDLVDRRVRELLVLADRALAVERPDADEPRAGVLVRQDRQAAVDLHRVGGDELGRDPLRDRLGDGRLARRGRAEDREDARRDRLRASSSQPSRPRSRPAGPPPDGRRGARGTRRLRRGMPSSSGTCGSQPSRSCALRMSAT